MAVQRRPLGQAQGPNGRPPSQGGGTMGGGMGKMPSMDTAAPRHLASATPMGPQGPPMMQPGGAGMPGAEGMGGAPSPLLQDPNSATGMLGDGGVLMRLLAMLGGRG